MIYILKLDKGMLVNILQVLQAKLILPTCPKCFLQTFIIVLLIWYSHMVCLPLSKLLKWGPLDRQKLRMNDCLTGRLVVNSTHGFIPTRQTFTQSHITILRLQNDAYVPLIKPDNTSHTPVTVTTGRSLFLVKLSSVSGRALYYYC